MAIVLRKDFFFFYYYFFQCRYGKFGLYNIVGAILWTVLCTGAGYVFGNVPAVHDNFSLVVLGIVVVSLLPVIFEVVAARAEKKKE